MNELDLKELLLICWKKKIMIIVITLISIIIGAVYSYCYIKPIYKASTKLALVQDYIGKDVDETKLNTKSLTINTKLLITSTEIIKSDIVLEDAVQELQIEGLTVESLKSGVEVQNIKDTDIIEITIKNKDSNVPAAAANKIAEVFSKKISEMYKEFGNVYVLEEAKTNDTPFNINHKKDLVIFAFIGVVISAGVILVETMFSSEDENKYRNVK